VPPAIEPYETFGYALKQAQQAMRSRMDRSLSGIGLTAPQYAVLVSLEAEPGASNATLARRAFVTPQTMQGMLAKLERGGMIARGPDAEHGRIRRTELTERGRHALRRAHEVAAKVERRARAALDPVDPDEATRMLLRAAKALR
jgi:DNA-binding MarR family transcriptional regulator